MPDSTKMTVEELFLSEDAMSIYLNSLPMDSVLSIKQSWMISLKQTIEKWNILKEFSLFGDLFYLEKTELMENFEIIFYTKFSEKVNGELVSLFDYMKNNGGIEKSINLVSSRINNANSPGQLYFHKWLNLKVILVIKGQYSNQELRYTIPLYK